MTTMMRDCGNIVRSAKEFVVVALAAICLAAAPSTVPLNTPSTRPSAPPWTNPNLQRDIEYGTAAGKSLNLDAYVPPGAGPFPVAIIVHGGGWSGGDKGRDITVLFGPLSDAKFVWFSINYRLSPKYQWPACYD